MFKKININLGKIILIKRAIINNAFKQTNLYFGQHSILEVLKKHNGSTQVEIAEKLDVTAASIAISTKRMEKNGLLYKKIYKKNLRCKKIYVTEKGIKSLDSIHKEINKINEYMFKNFDKEEIISFDMYLDKIMVNILDYKDLDSKVDDILQVLSLNMDEEDE